jgi:hypothetical protein
VFCFGVREETLYRGGKERRGDVIAVLQGTAVGRCNYVQCSGVARSVRTVMAVQWSG